MDFREFKKIPRLTRECVITEKIDGTNASIYIGEDGEFLIGSRTRWITPESDNHGFAKWVLEHKEELLTLGIGIHYGEWWGKGIQRGYGLEEKRFSLFNAGRWVKQQKLSQLQLDILDQRPEWEQKLKDKQEYCPDCCEVVPILYEGTFDTNIIETELNLLKRNGSFAVPGYMKPEGIVIYHRAGKLYFKKTIEKDEEPTGKNE